MLSCVFCTVGFFFFSSRRRHTRCLSDWSSDVCSSDLTNAGKPTIKGAEVELTWAPTKDWNFEASLAHLRSSIDRKERRVGKECRSRWSPKHEKEKRELTKRRKTRKDMEELNTTERET